MQTVPSFSSSFTLNTAAGKESISLYRDYARTGFSLLVLFFYLSPKFGDANEKTPKNYCRREKYISDISGRVYSQDAIFIAYAIVQQKMRIYIRVFSH